MKHRRLNRATLEGVELEYETRGAGEPVVLMHAGVCGDFFKPLAEEPLLADRYRLVCYHRVGYVGSSRLTGAVSIEDQAAHCHSLMRHLGIERAHIVGHSSSAMMGLQLALSAPETVQTLALLDAARPAPASELQIEFVNAVVQPALQRYGAGDKAGAVDIWMQGTCGPNYRASLQQALPDAFDQAVADADTFFGQELPAVQQWSFTQEDATHITQPVLAVLGALSRPVFRERRELLLAWLPHVEPFVLPDATHLLHIQNPSAMAEGLTSFFARHPVSASSP
jgi:pimeloyl-ACP methyl ester carboxylesterase